MSLFNAGKINTISAIYGLANIYLRLSGGSPMASSVGYRPSQWGNVDSCFLVKPKSPRANIGGLFFDAIMNTSINNKLTVTSHPVQGGANISDHAYMEPVEISMEVAMSDAMDSYAYGQFQSVGMTKSVCAYKMLCELQASRVPMVVTTRLGTYQNMVITDINPQDDVSTLYGLRCSVAMRQVLMANVTNEEKVSARPWVSGSGSSTKEVQPVEKQKPGSIIYEGEKALGI